MAGFKLKIELGNAAMSTPTHVARALSRVADKIIFEEAKEGKIQDENGNVVGDWKLTLPNEDDDT